MIFGPRENTGSKSNVSRKTAEDWNDILFNLKFWWGKKKSRCAKLKDLLFLLLSPQYVSHKCVSSKLRRWSCLKFRSLETPRKIVKCLSLSLVPVCSTFFYSHYIFMYVSVFKIVKKTQIDFGFTSLKADPQIFVKTQMKFLNLSNALMEHYLIP